MGEDPGMHNLEKGNLRTRQPVLRYWKYKGNRVRVLQEKCDQGLEFIGDRFLLGNIKKPFYS